MEPPWSVATELSATFLLSTLAGWIFTTLRRGKNEVHPVPGALVRISGQRQVLRCRIEEIDSKRWVLGPPLVRDGFHPMSVGDRIVGEVEVSGGAVLFRSILECVDRIRGRIWIRSPKRTYRR